MKSLSSLLAFALLTSATATASAATKPDLSVSFTAPAGLTVYQSGRFDVKVRNLTNKTAFGAELKITLPATLTSPTVHVLGALGSFDGRCTRSGVVLTCPLGNRGGNSTTTVSFWHSLPYSINPIDYDVAVTATNSEVTTANNTLNAIVSPLTYNVAINGPVAAHVDHCTGTSLQSYYECTLYPSSITSHDQIFHADGTITFPLEPTYGGTWSQPTTNTLVMQYNDGTSVVADFTGGGTSAKCFEGATFFSPPSPYMSMYRICLP